MTDKAKRQQLLLDRILKAYGSNLLHFKCRRCGTAAYAASLDIAKHFGGWTRIKRLRRHYTGLCIDCSPSTSNKRRPS